MFFGNINARELDNKPTIKQYVENIPDSLSTDIHSMLLLNDCEFQHLAASFFLELKNQDDLQNNHNLSSIEDAMRVRLKAIHLNSFDKELESVILVKSLKLYLENNPHLRLQSSSHCLELYWACMKHSNLVTCYLLYQACVWAGSPNEEDEDEGGSSGGGGAGGAGVDW